MCVVMARQRGNAALALAKLVSAGKVWMKLLG